MNRWFLGTLVVISVFTSCKKEDDKEETKPVCLLTKMTQGLDPDKDTVFMFKYHPDGRPSSMSFEGDPGNVGWFDFIYKSGTTTLEKVFLDGEGNDDWVMSEFEYNALGNLTRAKTFVGKEYTYTYNSSGQLNRVGISEWGSPESTYFTVVLDNNGNLVEAKRFFTHNNQLLDGFTLEYTDIENGIGRVNTVNLGNIRGLSYLFPGSDFFPFPSKYLVKKRINKNSSNEPGQTVNYTYETDAKSNVTKAVVSFIYQPTGETRVLTWRFDYECK